MGRLIDAEELKNELRAIFDPVKPDAPLILSLRILCDWIDTQPGVTTATSARAGRWEKHRRVGYEYRCSVCGTICESDDEHPVEVGFRFCPNCGANNEEIL